MAARWDQPLSRPLRLASGRELASLREAANLVLELFDNLTGSAFVAAAVNDMRQAAETACPEDVARATISVERLVRFYGL